MKKRIAYLRRHPPNTVIVGTVMLVLAVLAFYVAITHNLPFLGQSGRLVTAYFSEPNQLQAGSTPVRVDGIQVGTVDSVSLADGGREGKVVLRLTNNDIQLHADASAAVTFRTLLGANFVVDLTPGSASAPPLGSAGIPIQHTTVQVELDDVLRVFNLHTGLSTRVDFKQLDAFLDGPEGGRVIDLTAPSLALTPVAFDALRGEDPGDLGTLVATASQTTHTLAADRADLENLISGGSATLSAVAGQRQALGQALADAPGALDETVDVSRSVESTTPALNRLLTALGPGAQALSPSAQAARPAVTALRVVLDRAQPLLASLRPAITKLSSASVPGTTLLNAFTPTLSRLNSQILPWLDSSDSNLKLPIYELVAPTFAALDSAASEYDDHSHVVHFPVQPELNSVTLIPCTAMLKAPTPQQTLNCSNLNSLLNTLIGGSGSSTGSAKR